MSLSKLQSIRDCRAMWTELAETGNANKHMTLTYKRTESSCSFCSYVYTNGKTSCTYCPAFKRWSSKKGKTVRTCMREDSYYLKWIDSTTSQDRKKWAQKIVDLCNTLEKEYLAKGRKK